MRARPFTPTKESAQALDDRTVGREQLLAILHERLTAAATSRSRPHTLLVGPRGSGKTHVLEVALHRARLDPRLEPRLAIARISEDAVTVTRFTDLLTEAGRALRLALPRSRDPIELEQALSAAVGDRVLVLVVENLDRVFDTIGRGGQQDLRSWVETSGQVLLLAATPGLSTDFTDRAKPWFGGMIREPVEDLTAEQGRDLLTRLATEADDEPLAQLLRSDVGRARVEAVSRLTGGSPRIWMILAGCVSVDSLDELIPAVEDLLEGLVPYYQQMLFDLPPNHRMLVQELAEGDVAALTPTELAERTALSHQTVTKALELLQRGRWVIGAKIPGGDRRRTLYSLREPMLRHHFQYRSSSEPLALIVGMLRSWFAPRERHRHLAQAPAASFAERYLAESLGDEVRRFDDAYNDRDPAQLLSHARLWLNGADDVYPPEAGILAELCVLLAQSDVDVAAHLTARGRLDLVDQAGRLPSGAPLADLLTAAAKVTTGATLTAVGLVAASWVGQSSPRQALDVLVGLTPHTAAQSLALRGEIAYWTGETGGPNTALTLFQALLPDRETALGPTHPDTLRTRAQIAYYTGETGDPHTALTLYQGLLPDYETVLGPTHPDTLATRRSIAVMLGRTGRFAEALAQAPDEGTAGDIVLDAVRHAEEPPMPDPHLVNQLWRAVRGDEEAMARLPSELLVVARDLRAELAESDTQKT